MEFQEFANKHRPTLEQSLRKELPRAPVGLAAAMRYSVLLPGKRIRPLLVLACAEVCGGEIDAAMRAAVAVEFVHTFSLIHDDLPVLDDDDYRRGKISNHKKFGEAQAILAGDGLLALAASILSSPDRSELQSILMGAATRMIAGESLDVATNEKKLPIEKLKEINRLKTAALFVASAELGAASAEASEQDRRQLSRYGQTLGELFQLTDDLLDWQQHSQKKRETIVDQLGFEKSHQLIHRLCDKARRIVQPFGQRGHVLVSLAELVRDRIK